MQPANLSLWLNISTLGFASGPFDASPFFAPLNTVQNAQLTVDVYYVSPTGNAASPWTYLDPSTFLQATISFGDRFNYTLYASTNSFVRYIDQYGPKARFSISLVSNQLNNALSALASVVAIFQATWQTNISNPVAQLSAQIAKMIGSGIQTNNTSVQVFPNITALTGTSSSDLAAIATANGAVELLTIVEVVGVNSAGQAAQYQLQSYQGSQVLPGIVLPNDYNSVSNPVAWFQVA